MLCNLYNNYWYNNNYYIKNVVNALYFGINWFYLFQNHDFGLVEFINYGADGLLYLFC
jgi:hypothetical protein